jgi:uncharacterized SAM-binding protein YcdF (DUF218 family)
MSHIYVTLVQLLEPFTFCYLLTMIGLIALWRTSLVPRRRLKLFTALFALLTLVCMPAVTHLALGTLEWRYLPPAEIPIAPEAIVILGGATISSGDGAPFDLPAYDTLIRCIKGANVYRSVARCPVVASGGKVDASIRGSALAHIMRNVLLEHKVHDVDILIEDQSTSTYENAVQTRRLLESRQITTIVLVTDAPHLFRAELCFRKQGFDVVPLGCNYRTTYKHWSILDFVPNPHAAAQMNLAAHEWLGIVWYRIHDRI